eukprot:1364300-Pyramimonas_sp.AAC.2
MNILMHEEDARRSLGSPAGLSGDSGTALKLRNSPGGLRRAARPGMLRWSAVCPARAAGAA